MNDVQYAGRNPLIVVSTVPDPAENAAEPPDVHAAAAAGALVALAVHRTTSSASASTDTSDVRLDVSPQATSSRCGDDDDDDDDERRRMSSTVFTFDINVDDQSDYDV